MTYLCVPGQGSPYSPLFAEIRHDFCPLQFFLEMSSGLFVEQRVVFMFGDLHVLLLDLPYVACLIWITWFHGHVNLVWEFSQITFLLPSGNRNIGIHVENGNDTIIKFDAFVV